MRLKDLSDTMGAELSGPEDVDIIGVAGIRDAGRGYITFIDGTDRLKDLGTCEASAAFAPLDTPEAPMPLLRVKNPRLAFARAIELFYGKQYHPFGISEQASIGQDVVIGEECSVYPFVVLADKVKIGKRVTIYPGAYIGASSSIGDDTIVYANASIGHTVVIGKRVIVHSGAVIGSDGFGFVTEGGMHHKIPQVGGVLIEDDVEIGANCSIDRGTLGNTRIKKGTKLDNQVHIAHNVTIGEHCLLAGQVGIAGSSTLGNYVVFGGQAGVADHTVVGDRVMAGGKAVITKDIEAGHIVAGFNAMPLREWLKVQAVLPKLPELKRRILELEKQIKELRERGT